MTYQDLLPVGSALIIGATCFGLGAIYGNLPYDVNTLWQHDETGNSFNVSLAHYTVWANAPRYVHHIFHGVIGLGLIGSFIKLFKPVGDAKYFEYGSLIMYMVGVVIYLSNLRIGINSCYHGQWGEVDMPTGINVIAASQVMIVVALVGVLVLQGGLYYAQWCDNKVKMEFFEEEARREAAAAEGAVEKESVATEPINKPSAKLTGASTTKSTAGSTTKTKSKKISK